MAVYGTGFAITTKADTSPVTQADLQADALILAGLAALTPDLPVITEEQVAAGHVADIGGGRFWLVDPLDGTKEFCARVPDFTVNLALIDKGRPVLGLVGVPATGEIYWGGPGVGAFCQPVDGGVRPIQTRPLPAQPIATASRSHRDGAQGEAFIARFGIQQTLRVGSALKLVLVARGDADLHPRFSTVSEWDLAAGHALVEGAGGAVVGLDGRPLQFGNAPHFICQHYVVCSGALRAGVVRALAAQ